MKLYLNEIIAQISIALDAVEQDLLGASTFHGARIGLYCLKMAKSLNFSDMDALYLSYCAMLHDNALTEYILSERPGKEQVKNLKSHCVIGESNMRFLPMGDSIQNYILYHHERPDGKGPFGLIGTEIPLAPALIAIADQVDVAFHLQKRTAKDLPKIAEWITSKIDVLFLPEAAQAAIQVLDETLLMTMKNDTIQRSLMKALSPNVLISLTSKELVMLSGMVSKIIDYKSSFTRKHSLQIANKAWFICKERDYDEDKSACIYLAASLHDVGKLMIPSSILEKPGELTSEEYEIIKSHVRYTWDILGQITGFEEIARWSAYHHEKLDGSGYPFGLKAADLDPISRLMACLDIYQAVSEARPYHPKRGHRETMEVLYHMAQNGLIDAEIVAECDSSLSKLHDQDAPLPEFLQGIY